jgi:hypothetical protein
LRIAAFEDAYAAAPGIPTNPDRDEILMMDPVRAGRIARIACFHLRRASTSRAGQLAKLRHSDGSSFLGIDKVRA